MLRLASLALLLAVLTPAAAQDGPFEEAFPDLLPLFDRPVDIQMPPDGGRFFVVEQPGVITSFENDPAVSARDTLLDLRDVVNTEPSWEEGLLGLAFHPDYATNGYFFVHYTTFPAPEEDDHRTIIARFTVPNPAVDVPVADRASEVVLLDIEQPFTWHNGGQLAFHPDDGYLYLSLGDGGAAGDPAETAQDRTNLLGSILRLDVDDPAEGLNYGIPPDNPFVGNAEGWREEIWAWGLRNPWRFSIDPATGDLWIGDVGQNQWEEVTRVREAGANLGWDVKEAVFCFEAPDPGEPPCDDPDLLDPIWWYEHEDGNNSVTGGRVYRGTLAPSISGHYVYGDFISGRVWALEYEGLTEPINREIADLDYVAVFGTDEEGELYLASFDGRLYRLARNPIVASEPAATAPAPSLRLAGPNPFTDATTLRFTLREAGPVRIAVYDVLGREVAVLRDGPAPAGEGTVRFEAGGVAPGTYVVRMTAGETTTARTLTLVR